MAPPARPRRQSEGSGGAAAAPERLQELVFSRRQTSSVYQAQACFLARCHPVLRMGLPLGVLVEFVVPGSYVEVECDPCAHLH
eukprot:108727-Alexandrium_andersonii.AAC.1